ncbi:Protein YicC [Thermodesulfovibrio sp. N1]|uniref:YicC/YloC family endoribonuclease n=1 Tax=unclassified Thermodesulfovibrio TaxID=2645936 RepID=UPI00083AE6DA|nr:MULTISPECIES: YicC/YloC family endoribonuclease [unclassified Thermodesulfovibrio]MDI1470975.1 YicC family protein [Thermodesulfovibrio sp. 1176]ODA43404.1 Protein YicC [Thermodesulfovibrio sp. N1]
MIESLTGYGTSERDIFRVEAKSLNHRFLEINIKLPTILSKHEYEIRNLIKNKFQRGKIDLIVSINQKEKTGKVYLNKKLAMEVYSAFIDLKKELSILGSIDISIFSNFKELFVYEEEEPDVNNFIMAVSEALERLKEMRKREGELIKESIIEIVNNIEKEFINLENRVDISYNNHINSIRERVKEIIIQNNIDDNKILEQIIIYAQKSDIKEEVDRLRSHIIQFKETLEKGGIIGKKLDFLLQEMNRETNTILAKTEDFQIKTISVDLKTYIERLREQVQNIQ